MADPEGQTSANEVNLVFKNPSRPLDDTFSMPCATSMTIGDLKTALQSEYPGKPASQAITVRDSDLNLLFFKASSISIIINARYYAAHLRWQSPKG